MTHCRHWPRGLALLGVVCLAVGLAMPAYAQTATLSGFVTDETNGQALELVNIVLEQDGSFYKGAASDADGRYLIPRIAPGRYVLRASYLGYQTYVEDINIAPTATLSRNIALSPGGETLEEVLVEAERTTGAARVTAGLQTVRPQDIELIPAPDVSGDLATFLTTQPGVVTTGDRGGQLFIRGGEPSQNLVLLDGILIYQPFHVLGFYSAFPSEIINKADIYAGGFGSSYGERISSVIDVTTRSGNNRQFGGSVALSPFVSSVRAEGPIVPGRASWLLVGRQGMVEDVAAEIVGQDLPFTFGDAFGKINVDINASSRLGITALQTYDRGTLGETFEGGALPEEVRWENQAIGARYLVLPRIFPVTADLKMSHSRLTNELGPSETPDRTSEISNTNFAVDMRVFGDRADFNVGAQVRFVSIDTRLEGLFQNIDERAEDLQHGSLYAEPVFKWDNGLELQAGLRLQFYAVRFDPFWEPRARLVWQRPWGELSAAAGIYHQTILGLNDRRDAASIFTAWTDAPKPQTNRTDDIRVGRAQQAWHGILGYRGNPTPWLEVAVEGFFKYLDNLFVSEWTAYPRFTTNLQPATGRVFGFDVRSEVRRTRFYGYLTYGYANTRYEAEQAALDLWYGTETLAYRPAHDRRHQINALGATTVRGFDLSVRWAFGAGLPFNQAVGFDGFALVDDVVRADQIEGSRRVIYERPYNATLPTYHRLDISVDRTFELGVAALTVQASAINTYDRRNLFYLDVFTLRRVDQLPFVPSLGLKLEVN